MHYKNPNKKKKTESQFKSNSQKIMKILKSRSFFVALNPARCSSSDTEAHTRKTLPASACQSRSVRPSQITAMPPLRTGAKRPSNADSTPLPPLPLPTPALSAIGCSAPTLMYYCPEHACVLWEQMSTPPILIRHTRKHAARTRVPNYFSTPTPRSLWVGRS